MVCVHVAEWQHTTINVLTASTLSNLAFHIPIEDLLIPPSTYLHDRRISDDIFAPYATGRRAFNARQPFPINSQGKSRFPRVLRETTSFLLMEQNIVAEGLFRVPPHAKLKEVLKEAYDRGQKFIIWKDNGEHLPVPKYPGAEHQEEIIAEIDQKDAYSVFMAASLIKAWYADLRQPLFPQASYRDLKRLYGDPDDLPDLQKLTDLISPSSEWSFLPAGSREILVRHLLPLLAAVSARQEQNSMTAENLAVCFAPALLCGPDQLEDAKMSSIIRRVVGEAVKCWSEGLREACGVEVHTFEEELPLPADQSDWEDPVEGRKGHPGAEVEAEPVDEHQITGIILQDNEASSQQPPPLPPRSSKPQMRSASGPSSNEPVTKRKPAPPLQVPPRYSTIITDSPTYDVADSPSSYAAVTDGFAPSRPSQLDGVDEKKYPDEKKLGTNLGDVHENPSILVPKRKALTAEQIENAESAVGPVVSRKSSQIGMALPGLVDTGKKEPLRRKAVPFSQSSIDENSSPPPYAKTGFAPPSRATSSNFEFRRPSWPASKSPTITSLARPVMPVHPVTNRPASKSTSLPVPGPKPRAVSAGLLHRMPSFETSNSPPPLNRQITPRRLNMKKASVDDLRRLYEERVDTARTLVLAGLKRQ
jgi:Rho GTPase-activating protein 1